MTKFGTVTDLGKGIFCGGQLPCPLFGDSDRCRRSVFFRVLCYILFVVIVVLQHLKVMPLSALVSVLVRTKTFFLVRTKTTRPIFAQFDGKEHTGHGRNY